ncbi:DNA adenine methylase [Halorhabdus amylolytica]|uniref:DNA adenine methylase n=1 Tax=Halorhabdus amylolytica TaxID=2559573 RepID=UPI0010AAE51A|nr:DNA adenine methylase [Halorhabdus amylolytica]
MSTIADDISWNLEEQLVVDIDERATDRAIEILEESGPDERVSVRRVLEYAREDRPARAVRTGDWSRILEHSDGRLAIVSWTSAAITEIGLQTDDEGRRPFEIWTYSGLRERTGGYDPITIEGASKRSVRDLLQGTSPALVPVWESHLRPKTIADGGTSLDGFDQKGAFPYPGSKGQLASWIIDHFPSHNCYVEPFGGSAAVLLQKPESSVEVLNDTDGDIVHFFEVLRDREDELIAWLENTPFSRDLHRKYSRQYYAGFRPDNDIERAGRWFYLRNTQFAQKYTGVSGFRLSRSRNHASSYQNRSEELHAVADRLRDVQIANRDYGDLVDRTDGEKTLYYFDPPYIDAGDALYSHENAFDHERFTDILDSIEGSWIVSYTELPKGLESEYRVVEKTARGTMRSGQGDWHQENTERLVMNFDPDRISKFVNETTCQQTLPVGTDEDSHQSTDDGSTLLIPSSAGTIADQEGDR